MGKRVKIRNIEINDMPALYDLGVELFAGEASLPAPWNADSIAEIVSASMSCSIVAVQGKKLLGFILATYVEDSCQVTIHWLGVLPQVEKTALKEKLVIALRKEMKARDIFTMNIQVDARNSDAVDFFKKIGFTEEKHILTMSSSI